MSTNTGSEDEDRASKKKALGKKKDKTEKKDKGYKMFEQEDSEEESLFSDDVRSPAKMKKHSKPSFKFAKKEKFIKPKEKEKEVIKEKEKEKIGAVFKGDRKLRLKPHKKKISLGSKGDINDGEVRPIFGVSLAEAVERSKCHDGIMLPALFRECIDYIEEFGLTCEGIYRISGVKSKVQALKEAYQTGAPYQLQEHEPNVVASLLKQYLRELPEAVLTPEIMPKFEQASTLKNVKAKVEQFQKLIEDLPTPNRLLLSWTIVHMTHIISKENINKMSLQNVSIVLSPTMQISHRVLNVLFTYSKILFRDTVIKKYVPPLRPASSKWSLELPESSSALEEELKKQESLLSQLHEHLLKGADPEKEEQLWEVQRVVTQLKRKLKNMKKSLEKDQAKPSSKPIAIAKPVVETIKENEDLNLSLDKPEEAAQPAAQTDTAASPVEKSTVPVEPLQSTTETVTKEAVVTREKPVGSVTSYESDFEDQLESNEADTSLKKVESVEEVEGPTELEENNETADVDENDRSLDKMEVEQTEETEEYQAEEKTPTDDKADPEDPHDSDEVLPSAEEPLTPPISSLPFVAFEDVECAEQVVDDFCQMERREDEEAEDVELQKLQEIMSTMLLEEEELKIIGDELRHKIDGEKAEAERLQGEYDEVTAIREELLEEESDDSDRAYSSDSSDEEEDMETLQHQLAKLGRENKEYERRNAALTTKVHEQRQICLNVKVQVRKIQAHRRCMADEQLAAHRAILMSF